MSNRGRKRRRSQTADGAEYALDAPTDKGVEPALTPLRDIQPSQAQGSNACVEGPTERKHDRDSSEGWQVVERTSKKQRTRKKQKKQKKQSANRDSKLDRRDNRPALTCSEAHRLNSSLRINDLQALVLYCLADGISPQWISVRHHSHIKKAVVLLVPGLEKGMFIGGINLEVTTPGSNDGGNDTGSIFGSKAPKPVAAPSSTYRTPDDYLPLDLMAEQLPRCLQPLASFFVQMFPIKAPGDDKYHRVHSPLHAMLTAALPKSQDDQTAKKHMGGARPVRQSSSWKDEPTPITAFLSSNEDLLDSGYTLHSACFERDVDRAAESARRSASKTTEIHGWRETIILEGIAPASESWRDSLTAGRTVYAVDCEMCKVEGGENALTRVSIVDWEGNVVMDELVKPDRPIVDYVTAYSGITAAALAPVTTTLADIQGRLLDLLTPRSILIGHSLNSDLEALKFTHPSIVDTSILFPHPRGPPLKSSLKWLAQKYLSREIQKNHGSLGHDSIEDARACLDLVKEKCQKGPKWAAGEGQGESIFKRLLRHPKSGTTAPAGGARDGKTGAVVDHGHPERTVGSQATVAIPCKDDVEVVAGVKRAILGDRDGAIVPGGGVDFTFGRLRELEALRGWSNDGPSFKPHPDSIAYEPPPAALIAAVTRTVERIAEIRKVLPPCTLFIVYSGTGDPREMARLLEMQRTFKKEYAVKKWDQLSVRWTDTEEQALTRACKVAREGLGFVCVT